MPNYTPITDGEFATPDTFNSRFSELDSVLLSRTTTSAQSLAGVLQGAFRDDGGFRYNVLTQSVAGDGATNDAAALAALAAGHYEVPSGTYVVGTSVTLPAGAVLRMARGAVLKPSSGVTLTLDEIPEAGGYQIFDLSAGGQIRLGPNCRYRTVRAEWYGAVGDGVTDNTLAIRRALASAATTSGIEIRFGLGTFLWDATYSGTYSYTYSNTTVCGLGQGLTTLKRLSAGTAPGFFIMRSATTNVTVRDIALDFNGAAEFFVGVRNEENATYLRDITVQRVKFTDSNPPGETGSAEGDRWATGFTTLQVSERIKVLDCYCEGRMQLSGHGGAGIRGHYIQRNHVVDGEQNAIAALVTISTASGDADAEGLWITDNIVDTPSVIGIFVGLDSEVNNDAQFQSVHVERNTVRGFRAYGTAPTEASDGAYGIYCRAAHGLSRGLWIVDNDLDGITTLNGVDTVVSSSLGIYLEDDPPGSSTAGKASWGDATIRGNKIRNYTYAGRIQRVLSGQVTGNDVTDAGGFIFENGSRNILVTGNQQNGGTTGFQCVATTAMGTSDVTYGGQVGPVYFYNNVVRNTTHASTSAGLFVQADSARTAIVYAALNHFTDDRTGGSRTQQYGILHNGAGAFTVDYKFNHVSNNAAAGVSGPSTSNVLLWNTGAASPHFTPTQIRRTTVSWPSEALAAGSSRSTSIAINGAAQGDHVNAALATGLQGTVLWGEAAASGTVVVHQYNPTASTVTVPTANLSALLTKV